MTDRQIATIIPGPKMSDGMNSCHGTKVMVGGEALGGVHKIVLTAEVSAGVWRAEIHCLASLGEISADAEITKAFPTLDKDGIGVVELTHLNSEAQEFGVVK